jgi:hypothetical protein
VRSGSRSCTRPALKLPDWFLDLPAARSFSVLNGSCGFRSRHDPTSASRPTADTILAARHRSPVTVPPIARPARSVTASPPRAATLINPVPAASTHPTPYPNLTQLSFSLSSFPSSLSVNLSFLLSLPHPLLLLSTTGPSFPTPLPIGRGRGVGKLGPAPVPRSLLACWVGQGQAFPRVGSLQGAGSGAEQGAFAGADATWHSSRHPSSGCLPGAERAVDTRRTDVTRGTGGAPDVDVTGDISPTVPSRSSLRARAPERDGPLRNQRHRRHSVTGDVHPE